MRIGIFGGTFDPIHNGHLAILKAAAGSGNFDRILVIPNAYPPHKSLEQISMATYRYEMTRIALEATEFEIPVILSDIELFRKGKSYTLDTILELKTDYSFTDQFILIYGSDVAYEIENWHMPQQIMAECELFFTERPGFGGTDFREKIGELIDRYAAKITVFPADYVDISSTELREMLISDPDGASVHLLPEVKNWIEKNKIYGYQSDLSRITPETLQKLQEYECILQNTITKNRLVHSVNTMREAVRLAALFDGDIQKSAIAGLLHDCAKSLAKTRRDLFPLDDILHAYQGRQVACDLFRIEDEDILNAIYYHTTSRAKASRLEKILFVADKIEPSREFLRIDEIREIASRNLDEGMLACLADIIQLLRRTGKTPHPDSLAAYEELLNNQKETIN